MEWQDYYRAGALPIKGLLSVRDARDLPPGALKECQNWVWADDGVLRSVPGTTVRMDEAGLAEGTPVGLTREPVVWGTYRVALCAIAPDSAPTTVRVYYRKYDTSTSTLDASWTESTAGSGQWGDTRGTLPAYGSVEFEQVADRDGVVGCIVQFGNRSENVLLVNFAESFAAVPVLRISPPDWGQAAVQEFGFSGWLDVKSGTIKTGWGTNGIAGTHYNTGGTFDVAGDGELNLSAIGNGLRTLRWLTGTTGGGGDEPDVGDYGWHQFDATVDLSGGRQIVVLYVSGGNGVESYFNNFAWSLTRQVDSGANTSVTANKLVQSGQNFLTTVEVGDTVVNTSDSTRATVTAVDSNTTLSLSADIFTATPKNFVVVRRWVFHDPSAATPLNTVRFPGSSDITGVATFAKPQDADLSAVDGLWIECTDAEGTTANSYLAVQWLAVGGTVRGGSEYAVCLRSSTSKTDSPGVVLENAAEAEEQAAPQRVVVDGASVNDAFVFPRSPDVYFTVRVPVYAPAQETVNGVSAPSGWADRYSVYRRDPGGDGFFHVADVTVAAYSGGAWVTDSSLFGGTSEWKALAYYEDTAASDDRDFNRRAPDAFVEPVPVGQAMRLTNKRLYVGAFTGAGAATTATPNEVWASEAGQPFRFRDVARVEDGVLDPDAGFSVPLGVERVRRIWDVSASLLGSSSVYAFTDKSLFRLDGPVARRIALTGCAAPASLYERNGRAYYVDSEGCVKRMEGTIEDLSLYSVQDALDACPDDRLALACGCVYRHRYVLALADADDDRNYRLLVWHETAQAWEAYHELPAAKAPQYFMLWEAGGAAVPYFMADDQKVYELFEGEDFAGTDIEAAVRFADFLPRTPGDDVEVGCVGMDAAAAQAEAVHTRTAAHDGSTSAGTARLSHPTAARVRRRDSVDGGGAPGSRSSSVAVRTTATKTATTARLEVWQLAAQVSDREVLGGSFEA